VITAPDRRVFITGLGVVSAIGSSQSAFWDSCIAGRSRIEEIPHTWHDYYLPKSRYWSPVADPSYADYGLRRVDLLSYDKAVLNAIVAADDALESAGLVKRLMNEKDGKYSLEYFPPQRSGVFCGSGLGCITSAFDNYVPHLLGSWSKSASLSDDAGTEDVHRPLKVALAHNPRVSPIASLKSMSSSLSAVLSIRYGIRGPNETVMAACAAGSWAISRGFESIQNGQLDFALCGGSEYYGDFAGAIFMAFDRLGTLVQPSLPTHQANRPFDVARSGFLFSQGGACMLALETLKSARDRGRRPFAEILGVARSSDANSLVAISQADNSISSMILSALSSACLQPQDIDYINAHGTGTIQNDEIEASIIRDLFPHGPLINSTKSLLGHTIGASGAIEAAVTALSLSNQELHGSLNLKDPIGDLNFVRESSRTQMHHALTHNFGFGGHNVGIVMGRATE